jgi:S1-C subfamily serine protease
MIRTLLAAGFACLALVATAAASPPDIDRFSKEVIGPTVYIGGCTGTIIHSGDSGTYVLTARHCTKGGEDHEVAVAIPVFDKVLRKVRDEVYYALVNTTSFNSDLSTLKLLDQDARFDVVGTIATLDAPRRIGEPVWAVGYPAFPTMSVTEGTLGPMERVGERLADQSAKKEWQRAALNLYGGNSGGALWRLTDTGRYEIIGVATAGIRGSVISIFVSLEDIHEFLKRLPADVSRAIKCDGYRTANRACPQ